MKSAKETKKSSIVAASGSISGAASVLGSWQVCHSICIGIIIALSTIGITISAFPLLFLTKIAGVMWGFAAVLFAITWYLYRTKGCISSNLLLLNAGLLVMGIPFKALQPFILLFYVVGGALSLSGLVMLLQPLVEAKKWWKLALFSSLALLVIILLAVGALSKSTFEVKKSVSQIEQNAFDSKISGDFSEGNVVITARPVGFSKGIFSIELFFDTHAVDLSTLDLENNALLVAGGKTLKPISAPRLFGHHSNGKLIFSMDEEPSAFSLIITNVPTIQRRELEWGG